jgi:hypothetical protein
MNRTGKKFAGVLEAMPLPEQQTIRAVVREILEERDQDETLPTIA